MTPKELQTGKPWAAAGLPPAKAELRTDEGLRQSLKIVPLFCDGHDDRWPAACKQRSGRLSAARGPCAGQATQAAARPVWQAFCPLSQVCIDRESRSRRAGASSLAEWVAEVRIDGELSWLQSSR